MKDIAIVVYYHKDNKYSFNAVIGALETDESLSDIAIYFFSAKEVLIQELKSVLKKYVKVIVGISFFTTQLFETHDLLKVLRKKLGNKPIFIAGGPHPTGDPEGTLKLEFDVVIRGEGEETFVELVKAIRNNETLANTKGIAYFNNDGKYIYTGKRAPIDLDMYPPFPTKNIKFGAIEITRGCPYMCYFCQTPYILGTNPRHRSIDAVSKHIKILKNHYGDLTAIRFITPNAFSYGSPDGIQLNIQKLEELLVKTREILGAGGKIFLGSFASEVRPEHVTKETLGLVLKYAANDNITMGAQSGSQKILDSCRRGHTVRDIYKAVELTLASNLKVNVDFIFGLPNENEDDRELTIKMMKDLSKMGARIHGHSFIPLPQTPFAKQPVRKIDKNIKDIIEELTSKGSMFGSWKKQEDFAIKLKRHKI